LLLYVICPFFKNATTYKKNMADFVHGRWYKIGLKRDPENKYMSVARYVGLSDNGRSHVFRDRHEIAEDGQVSRSARTPLLTPFFLPGEIIIPIHILNTVKIVPLDSDTPPAYIGGQRKSRRRTVRRTKRRRNTRRKH